MEGTLDKSVARKVTAKLVVEGANGPTTPAAEEILSGSGIWVVPDLIANAGGVISSYFEWVQNHQRLAWPESDERQRVLQRLDETWKLVGDGDPLEWRTHALMTAITKVVDGMRVSGMVPRDLP